MDDEQKTCGTWDFLLKEAGKENNQESCLNIGLCAQALRVSCQFIKESPKAKQADSNKEIFYRDILKQANLNS